MITKEPNPEVYSNRIVVIDNTAVAEPVVESLQQTGYGLSLVNNNEQAIEYLLANPPALILFAVQPPAVEAITICRKIKADKRIRNIPVLFYNADEDESFMVSAFEAGAADILSGPVKEKVIVSKVNGYIRLRQQQLDLEKQNAALADTISQYKIADKAIQESEERFRSFVENANDTVFSITPGGILTYGSPNWTRVLGHDVSEFIGKSVFETLIHPDDIPVCLAAIQQAFATKEKQSGIEYRALHKDGSWRWQTTNASPVLNENGQIVSFIGIARDITQSKQTEDALHNIEQSYHNLFHTVTEAIYIQDQDGYFIDVNKGAEKMYGYCREEFIGRTPAFLSAPGKNDMVYITNLIAKTFTSGKSQQFEFWGKRKGGEIFLKEVICNKGIYCGKEVLITTARDISKRRLAEMALRESEEKFVKIFHLSPDVILLTRVADGVIVDINERAFDLGGYKREDVIGKTTLELEGWSGLPDRNQYVNLLSKYGRVINYEKKFKIKSGETKHATISGELIELNGEQFILTVIHDITDRKKAEEEIKESEARWQFALEGAREGVWDWDTQTNKVFYSGNWKAMLGFSEDEIGDTLSEWDKRVHPDDKEAVYANMNRHFKGELPYYESEHRLLCKDGSYKWILDRGKIISRTEEGKPLRVIGTHTDITTRKKAESVIEEKNAQLKALSDNLPDSVIFQTRFTGGALPEICYLSKGVEKFLGMTIDEVINDPSAFFNRILEEDRKLYFEARAVATQNNTDFNFDYRFSNRPGEIRWGNTRSVPRKQEDGSIVWDGFFTDITQRKLEEQALQNSLKEISDYKYALDQAANVSITDQQGIIKYVNDNFCSQYGFTKEEIIGKNHSLINSGYHPPSFWNNFWETIKTGQVFKADVCNRGKDGKLYWADTTIIPFLNATGIPYQYLAIRRDITKKRNLEKELARQQLHNQRLMTELTIQEQEKERSQVSYELHENINQVLATVKIYLSMIKKGDERPEPLLNQSYEYLNQAMKLVNKLSHSLVTPSLNDFGLEEALAELAEETNKSNGLQVDLTNKTTDLKAIDKKILLMLYRIVQVQLNNIIEHADAVTATISLATKDQTLYLTVADDGRGFDTSRQQLGLDLQNVKNRVEFYNGEMTITSSPGKGCTLEISIPLQPDQSV